MPDPCASSLSSDPAGVPSDSAGRPSGLTGAAAIVLAGGTGRRLGGVPKPDVELAGRRLLDHVLDAVRAVGCGPLVVVAPPTVTVPSDVVRTLEDPPLGGPVAGIAAGLRSLETIGTGGAGEPDVLVLACDMPGAGRVVGPLLRSRAAQRSEDAARGPGGMPDGVIAQRSDGHREMLAVLADRSALAASVRRGGDRDRSVRSLLTPLDLDPVPVADIDVQDVDTWSQHEMWQDRLTIRGRTGPTTRTEEDVP
jgi:molybdopterin-guanine dinucleotide biosynthesis protein A